MKKKLNVKIYGHKGFISNEETKLINNSNFYFNLYEDGEWYKSDDVKEIKVDNDISIDYVEINYKTLNLMRYEINQYNQYGGKLLITDFKLDKEDFDFILSGKALDWSK